MKPHLEEALLSLRLADRDAKAFEVLSKDQEVHLTVVFFHAQQAIEKSLKAALFANEIEFARTHDLIQLTQLLRDRGISVPASDGDLRRLNPFAVIFRYDDADIDPMPRSDAASMVTAIRIWAGDIVEKARKHAERQTPSHD